MYSIFKAMNCLNDPNHRCSAFRKPVMRGLTTLALCIGALSGCSTSAPDKSSVMQPSAQSSTSWFKNPFQKYPYYSFFYRSSTRNTVVKYYKFSAGDKTLNESRDAPIEWVGYIDYMPPVDKFIVEWLDKISNKSYREEVNLNNIVKSDLEGGTISFSIDDNHLSVYQTGPEIINKECAEKVAGKLAKEVTLAMACGGEYHNTKLYPRD